MSQCSATKLKTVGRAFSSNCRTNDKSLKITCYNYISFLLKSFLKKINSKGPHSTHHVSDCGRDIPGCTTSSIDRVTSLHNRRFMSQANNGLVTGALFFSSPRIALRTCFSLRAKCRVHLPWPIRHLLCRLQTDIISRQLVPKMNPHRNMDTRLAT